MQLCRKILVQLAQRKKRLKRTKQKKEMEKTNERIKEGNAESVNGYKKKTRKARRNKIPWAMNEMYLDFDVH